MSYSPRYRAIVRERHSLPCGFKGMVDQYVKECRDWNRIMRLGALRLALMSESERVQFDKECDELREYFI